MKVYLLRKSVGSNPKGKVAVENIADINNIFFYSYLSQQTRECCHSLEHRLRGSSSLAS